jgi:hypothetical protein
MVQSILRLLMIIPSQLRHPDPALKHWKVATTLVDAIAPPTIFTVSLLPGILLSLASHHLHVPNRSTYRKYMSVTDIFDLLTEPILPIFA